jgi:hypothetical protein
MKPKLRAQTLRALDEANDKDQFQEYLKAKVDTTLFEIDFAAASFQLPHDLHDRLVVEGLITFVAQACAERGASKALFLEAAAKAFDDAEALFEGDNESDDATAGNL